MIILSLSIVGCANRNTTLDDTPNVTKPIPPKYGTPSNNIGVGVYNNGIYLGQGTGSSSGNEAAIVTIRDGSISNIELLSIDTNGSIIRNETTNLNQNNQNNQNNQIVEPNNSGSLGAPNTTTTPNNIITNPNTTTMPGTSLSPSVEQGLPDTTTNPAPNTNVDTAASSLASVKKDLINNVIVSQSVDVNINEPDNIKPSVDSWKAAIRNALEKASK
jgi:hypothetical protein